MAASNVATSWNLQRVRLAEDFEEWFSQFERNWKPKFSKLMKSARRARPIRGRSGNAKLIEAGLETSGPVRAAAIRARAPNGPQKLSDSQLYLQKEAPLRQIVPFFEVKRSVKGGYGAFALADLAPSTIILSETALLESTCYDLLQKFQRLPTAEKEEYSELASFDKISANKVDAIFKTNRFVTTSGKSGIFPLASRFNHSCKPSCAYWYDRTKQQLVLNIKQDVTKGEEITISYGQSGFSLYHNWGFICDCGHCTPWTVPPEMSDHSSNWDLSQDKGWTD